MCQLKSEVRKNTSIKTRGRSTNKYTQVQINTQPTAIHISKDFPVLVERPTKLPCSILATKSWQQSLHSSAHSKASDGRTKVIENRQTKNKEN